MKIEYTHPVHRLKKFSINPSRSPSSSTCLIIFGNNDLEFSKSSSFVFLLSISNGLIDRNNNINLRYIYIADNTLIELLLLLLL